MENFNKKVLTKFLGSGQDRKISSELRNLYLTLRVFEVNFFEIEKKSIDSL